jgi:hypothetical protein
MVERGEMEINNRARLNVSIWLIVVVVVIITVSYVIDLVAAAQAPVWINGHCFRDANIGISDVTVSLEYQRGGIWYTYNKTSETKDRGIWGIGIDTTDISWLILKPVAPVGYTLYGASYPGGYQARYLSGVGIKLVAPSTNAGHFNFLFTYTAEATPTPIPTFTPIPTQEAFPTTTPFPGVVEWINPPQTVEDAIVKDSLDLVAFWLRGRGPLYWYAWDHGLGPFPVYGPKRVSYTDLSGKVWEIEYVLYPHGHLVWRDTREPTKVRITRVSRYSW